jgi:hypothetical protein
MRHLPARIIPTEFSIVFPPIHWRCCEQRYEATAASLLRDKLNMGQRHSSSVRHALTAGRSLPPERRDLDALNHHHLLS